MRIINEYDARQLNLMFKLLIAFEKKQVSLFSLCSELYSLVNVMENMDSNWRGKCQDELYTLDLLEIDAPEMEKNEIEKIVEKATGSLKKLVRSKLDEFDESQRRELLKTDLNIKEIADDLGNHWLMCPVCQESWENYEEYPMVRCPQCHQSLHNPCSKSAVKWSVKVNSPKNRLYEIKYLPDLGYCLYVFENDVRIYDDLQDSWESAIGCAWKQFNVDKNLWKKDEL